MPPAAGSQPQHDHHKDHVAINDDQQLNTDGGNGNKLGLQRVKTWRPLDKVSVSTRRYRDPTALFSQSRPKTPVAYSDPSTALASRITRQQFEALPPAIQRKPRRAALP
ncbi:unnamed protein product [Clonostachys rosea]|uniref:Vps72/YL1 C-terminal domain-containing protein n=1 Tax=Bionectria ochroleuca TaxID=29856 RepID=A0ABY6UY85_BIOOC|nr:unnamed protein product [Clonostachys rosea]